MLEDFALKPLIKSKWKLKAKTFSDCDCETQKRLAKRSKMRQKCVFISSSDILKAYGTENKVGSLVVYTSDSHADGRSSIPGCGLCVNT